MQIDHDDEGGYWRTFDAEWQSCISPGFRLFWSRVQAITSHLPGMGAGANVPQPLPQPHHCSDNAQKCQHGPKVPGNGWHNVLSSSRFAIRNKFPHQEAKKRKLHHPGLPQGQCLSAPFWRDHSYQGEIKMSKTLLKNYARWPCPTTILRAGRQGWSAWWSSSFAPWPSPSLAISSGWSATTGFGAASMQVRHHCLKFLISKVSKTDREELRLALATVEQDQVGQVSYQNSANGKLIFRLLKSSARYISIFSHIRSRIWAIFDIMLLAYIYGH